MKRLWIGLLCAASFALAASAQFSKTVGVSGTATAGTAFSMQISSIALTVQIDFPALATDYGPLAMAQLMIDRINQDNADRGGTGFSAKNAQKSDGRSRYDATYVIEASSQINSIMVGAYGNPSSPLPKAPGVGFNPNFFNLESNIPTPFTKATKNSTNARMLVNGQDPGAEFDHRVEIVVDPTAGASMTLRFSSGPNPNCGIMVFYGPFGHSVFSTATLWGDSLDLGTPNNGAPPIDVSVVADGIFAANPPLNVLFQTNAASPAIAQITFPVPPSMPQSNFAAFQALIQDPTNGPFNYRWTAAAQPLFDYGQEALLPVGADGFVPVNLRGGGQYRQFGNTYSQFFVAENGFISMTPPPSFGATIDPQGTVNPLPPAIFVNWSNWDLSAAGGLDIYEFGDDFRVRWGSATAPARHFGQTDSASFECFMRLERGLIPSEDKGAVMLNFSQLDASVPNDNDAIVGITPGQGLGGPSISRDLGTPQFSGAPGASLLSQFNRTGAFTSALSISSNGTLQPQAYSNGSGLNGRTIGFFPPPQPGSGSILDQYYSIPTKPNPNDFIGVAPLGSATFSRNPGPSGQAFNLLGFFRYLNAGGAPGVVIFDPFGPTPITLPVVGVFYAGQPISTLPQVAVQPVAGVRDFESLRVLNTATLSAAAYPNGTQVTIAVAFGAPTPANFIVVPNAVTIVP